jgi:hypothetical protein
VDPIEDKPGVDELAALSHELDAVDADRRLDPNLERPAVEAPTVRIGTLVDGGLAPAVAAIVERGVRRRPELAQGLGIECELKVEGPYPPIRIHFSSEEVLVEDGPALDPVLRMEGQLADLVHLLSAPIGFGGVPSIRDPRGRAAIGRVATGRVRLEGPLRLRHRVLSLLRI